MILSATQVWRRKTKQRIIDSFGGKCGICSYNKCNAALELHHLDPSQKESSIARMLKNPKSWEKLVIEIKKCVLLCSNCHREYHSGLIEIPFDIVKFNIIYEDYNIVENTHHYCICGSKLPFFKKHCSKLCCSKDRQEVNWSKEKIKILDLKDNQKLPFTKIAILYQVSDKTIAKWYNKFKKELFLSARQANGLDC